MSSEYYTAKEAMQILNKPSTTFYREVGQGLIPHVGKRPRMRFPKEAIDALAEVGDFVPGNGLVFEASTIADAWTKQEITRQPYEDEDAVPFKTVLEWRKMNNDISMHIKDENKLVGWVTFLPLDEKVIHSLIENKLREKDIPPQAIKKWTDRQISVYIPIIEVVPSGNEQRDKDRGAFLIKKAIRWAITLMIQHDIKNWYAIGTTTDGQNLLEALGFTEIASLEEGQRKGYLLETKVKQVKLISKIMEEMEGVSESQTSQEN